MSDKKKENERKKEHERKNESMKESEKIVQYCTDMYKGEKILSACVCFCACICWFIEKCELNSAFVCAVCQGC